MKKNGENGNGKAKEVMAQIRAELLVNIPKELLKDAPRKKDVSHKNADDVDTRGMISPFDNISNPEVRERLRRAQKRVDREFGMGKREASKTSATTSDPISPTEPIPDAQVPDSHSTPPAMPPAPDSLAAGVGPTADGLGDAYYKEIEDEADIIEKRFEPRDKRDEGDDTLSGGIPLASPSPDNFTRAMAQGPNQVGGDPEDLAAAGAAAAALGVAASVEPKPDGVAEPKVDAGSALPTSPDASKEQLPPAKEREVSVAGIAVTGELAERISAARAALEEERRAFAQKEYEETNAWDNITKVLGKFFHRKGNENQDLVQLRQWYEEKLIALNKIEIEALNQAGLSEEKTKEATIAFVASKKFDEAEALDDMRRAARFEGKPRHWGDSLYRSWEFIAKGYNQLSFRNKMLLAGGAFGLAGALAMTGAAGVTLGSAVMIGRRFLTGSGLAITLEALAERSATKDRSKKSQKESADFVANLDAQFKTGEHSALTSEARKEARLKALEKYLTEEVVERTDDALQKRKFTGLLRKSGAFFVGGVVGSGLIFQTEPGQFLQSNALGGLKWLYHTAFDGFDYSALDDVAREAGIGKVLTPGGGTPLEAGAPASAIPVESYAASGGIANTLAEQAQAEATGPPTPSAPIAGSAPLPEAPGGTPGSWMGKIETPVPASPAAESLKQFLSEYIPAKGDSLWKFSTDLVRGSGLDEMQAKKAAVAVEALIGHKVESDPSLLGKAGFINADLDLGEGKPFRLGVLLDQGELEKIMQEARAGKVSLPPNISGVAAPVDRALAPAAAASPAPSAPDIPTPGSSGALAAVETPSSTPLAPPGQTPEEIAVATGPAAPTETPAPAPTPVETSSAKPRVESANPADTLGTINGQPATVPNPALEAAQAETRPFRIAVPPPQELGKLSGIMSEKQLNTYLAHLPSAEQAAIHTRFTGLCRDIFALNPARVFSGDIPPNGLFDPLRNPRIMNAEVTTVLEHKLFATGTQNPLYSSQIARLEQLVQFAKDAFGSAGAPRPATQLLPAEKMQSYLIRIAALTEQKNIPLPRLVTRS